jgi:hypothetical protein
MLHNCKGYHDYRTLLRKGILETQKIKIKKKKATLPVAYFPDELFWGYTINPNSSVLVVSSRLYQMKYMSYLNDTNTTETQT